MQPDGMAAMCLCGCSVVGRIGEVLLKFLNMYAYTHVAVYGHSFMDASKACIALLLEVGLLPLLHAQLLQVRAFRF